jgi:hypothetical protein
VVLVPAPDTATLPNLRSVPPMTPLWAVVAEQPLLAANEQRKIKHGDQAARARLHRRGFAYYLLELHWAHEQKLRMASQR